MKRSFQGIFNCFKMLLEVPKFKENAQICVITVIKVGDVIFY